LEKYIDVVGEFLAGNLLKVGNSIRARTPSLARNLGDDVVGMGILLYQFKVVIILLRPKCVV
jgi:hypothetical protein